MTNDVDCMSCLVKLASGCPTNGETMMHGPVVCAAVWASVDANPDYKIILPAHKFKWSRITVRWMSFDGYLSCWALRNQ